MNTQCIVCHDKEGILKCARCRSRFYCCREHQQKDWKNHKESCLDISKNLYHIIVHRNGSPISRIYFSVSFNNFGIRGDKR